MFGFFVYFLNACVHFEFDANIFSDKPLEKVV